jgi:hypothetical protein
MYPYRYNRSYPQSHLVRVIRHNPRCMTLVYDKPCDRARSRSFARR